MTFDARPYLREIARGTHAARDLTREQARTLFEAVFAGEVADIALGALLVAFRVKGETAAELAGMMDALASHVRPLRLPSKRVLPLVVPTYNGARKLPNLLPLLALLVAREGVPVLLHGAHQEPARIGSFDILERLGHRPCASIDEAEERLAREGLAPLPLDVLSPDLARLLEVRAAVGVRNSGHTLAKLLLPQGVAADAAARLIAVTHPEFLQLMREHFAALPGEAFLMRGVEGEAVVRVHAPQAIEHLRPGRPVVIHELGPGESGIALPVRDAAATAEWTRDVLAGRIAAPGALARQAAFIAAACREGGAAHPPLRLVSSR